MDNTQKNKPTSILCPECESPIKSMDALLVGTVVECERCGTQSEVVVLSPLKLSPIEEEK